MAVPRATLELLHKGRPVKKVDEGQCVALMVNALKRLEGAQLYLGELKLRQVPVVEANTSVAVEFTFPDYIGENALLLKDSYGNPISNTLEVFVQPATMDYMLFEKLRDEHIPQLIAGAGAEDTAAQSYPGATPAMEEETINFNIGQLLEFSKALLGVTRRVLELLSYRIQTQRKKLKGHLRGSIRWQKTAVMRAQKGLDAATVHVADIRKRQWNTPTNLLLVRFHMEVFMEALFFRDEIDRREREKKAWATIYNTPYAGLDPLMKERMDTLEAVLKVHKEVLSNPKLKPLILEAKELRKQSEVFRRRASEESRRTKNRAYRELVELWRRFLAEYESYYEDVVQIHTRRMRDFYALWVATEIAGALKLRASMKSLRQFHSAKRDILLRYDAPGQIRQGWSDSILEMLFDEGADGSDDGYKKQSGGGGPELFLHYKGLDLYLEARYDLRQRPRPEDVYKVLAFMSNYKAPCGLILYPGPRLKLTYSREQGQVMAWIPFGPRSNLLDIAPDYLRFAIENVADLYRFMLEGKPVDKLAKLIEEAAADFYQTGGATALPEIERWQPPPDVEEALNGATAPELSPGERPPSAPAEASRSPRAPETEAPLSEPELSSEPEGAPELAQGPFSTPGEVETTRPPSVEEGPGDTGGGCETEGGSEGPAPPTPEEALRMEAQAHEAGQTATLEEAMERGADPHRREAPAEVRQLDYRVRRRQRIEQEGAGEPALGPPMEPSRSSRPPSRLTWSPDKTSRSDYQPMSEQGKALSLSMDQLRDLVHRAEDRELEDSTEWEEVSQEPATKVNADATSPPPFARPLSNLKEAHDPNRDPPPNFADTRDMPELPEGSEWVGRQERRKKWEGKELREADEQEK